METDNIEIVAQNLVDGIQKGNWWLVAGALLIGLVWLLRTQLPKLFPSLEVVMKDPTFSVLLPVLLSVGGAITTAALAGPVNKTVLIGIVVASLKVSFTSISGYVAAKKLKETAKLNGEAAAEKVKTFGDAVKERKEPEAP